MNDNTKIEVAREIMNTMIGRRANKTDDDNDPELLRLLEEEQEMIKFNFTVIDKILNVYGPMIRGDKR